MLKEEVTSNEICHVVSNWTGIPMDRLNTSDRERLIQLPERLSEKVVGQNEAIEAVSDAILVWLVRANQLDVSCSWVLQVLVRQS